MHEARWIHCHFSHFTFFSVLAFRSNRAFMVPAVAFATNTEQMMITVDPGLFLYINTTPSWERILIQHWELAGLRKNISSL